MQRVPGQLFLLKVHVCFTTSAKEYKKNVKHINRIYSTGQNLNTSFKNYIQCVSYSKKYRKLMENVKNIQEDATIQYTEFSSVLINFTGTTKKVGITLSQFIKTSYEIQGKSIDLLVFSSIQGLIT